MGEVVNKVEPYTDKTGMSVVPPTEGSQPFAHKQIHKTDTSVFDLL